MSENTLRYIKRYLTSDELTERQRETLQRFDKHKRDVRKWKSVNTRLGYVKTLHSLGVYCSKPYEDMTEEDIINFLDSRNINEASRSTYIMQFRCFFNWLYDLPKGQYPECISKLKPKNVPSKLIKSDLITEEDMKLMMVCALNPQNRAITPVLKECAFRPSEFLSMNVGDVEEKYYGFYVSCRDSKTDLRGVVLVWSARYLGDWLDHHPYRDDPEAPLWISFSRSNFGNRLTVGALNKLLKRLAGRAGIKKRIYPYLFRHSGATDLAIEGRNEAVMRRYCGWSSTSTMPARYTHLAGTDVEDAILEVRGVKRKPRKLMMVPKICPRCGEENGAEKFHCGKCGTSLDKTIHAFDEISEQEAEKEKQTADYENLKEQIRKDITKDIMRELGLQPPK